MPKLLPGTKHTPDCLSPVPILSKFFKVWDSTTNPDSAMLKAACCLAFFGFLRSAEFTTNSASKFDPTAHLSFRDIAIDSRLAPSLICIHIKQSKTDTFRQRVFLYIGRSHADICPVHLIYTVHCSQRR